MAHTATDVVKVSAGDAPARAAVILAAGAGTRMKSAHAKVAHRILGVPMVQWVTRAAAGAGLDTRVCVLGHRANEVGELVEGICEVAIQPCRRGTADAVKCAMESPALADFEGSVVVLNGDSPLITSHTLARLCEAREKTNAGAAALTMELDDPFGYGRIILKQDNGDGKDGCLEPSQSPSGSGAVGGQICPPLQDLAKARPGAVVTESNFAKGGKDGYLQPRCPTFPTIERIVEQKDASIEELGIRECNSGFYCFDAAALREALALVGTDNAQGEFYLTDVVEIMGRNGRRAIAVRATDASECAGVNDRVQLDSARRVMRSRINRAHMLAGVTIVDPDTTWIGPDVELEQDVTILPACALMGKTRVGADSVIGPNTRLTDTLVGRGCTVDETVAQDAQIDDKATCGPRAYLRPGAHICVGAKVGTHVEIKKSTIGAGSKVPHLSYIGDTTMGTGVNIGAGSITCNYDGAHKHPTTIGDNVFVGSDTMMVAPVSIGNGAVIGAGSTITRDVPEDALCVARARERIIDGWATKK